MPEPKKPAKDEPKTPTPQDETRDMGDVVAEDSAAQDGVKQSK